MLGRASGQWPAPESVSESFLESGGFVLTRATTEAIGRIDLAASNVCAPPRVMIVEDQGIGRGETEWVDGLHEADVEVIHEVWPGYGAMTSDPQLAKAPLALFERAAAVMGSWADLPPLDDVRSTALDLESRRRSKAGATNSNSVVIRVAGARLSNVRESIAVIPGGDVELFGILTEPEDTSSTRRPTVIMLNAGSVHHVGPNGLWVRLAREWAARGVSVLRFDLSGVGDSPPRSGADDNVPYSRFALADVESAIRFVRRGEDREIYALGLCSGGYHAFRAAVTGLPIRAAIMVNPLTYYWDAERDDELKPYELIELAEEYRHRLLRTTTWRRVFSGRIDFRLVARVVAQSAWSALRTRAHGVARGFGLSLERDLVADIDRAIQHGIDLRFIFAEGSPGYRLLERQTGRKLRAFEASGRLSIGTVPNADHTFTATVPRERLVERLNGLLEI
jgi:pimeloyl-ACP methyl ester carboxylesterase